MCLPLCENFNTKLRSHQLMSLQKCPPQKPLIPSALNDQFLFMRPLLIATMTQFNRDNANRPPTDIRNAGFISAAFVHSLTNDSAIQSTSDSGVNELIYHSDPVALGRGAEEFSGESSDVSDGRLLATLKYASLVGSLIG